MSGDLAWVQEGPLVLWRRASLKAEQEARARLDDPEEAEDEWKAYCEASGIEYVGPEPSGPPRSEEEELWEQWRGWL